MICIRLIRLNVPYEVLMSFAASLQNRCVNMIAHLFNAPIGEDETTVGVGTVGSSEAIMLAGLAFKRKWQNKRKAEGKPYDKPNIVTGANVQVKLYFLSSWDHSFDHYSHG